MIHLKSRDLAESHSLPLNAHSSRVIQTRFLSRRDERLLDCVPPAEVNTGQLIPQLRRPKLTLLPSPLELYEDWYHWSSPASTHLTSTQSRRSPNRLDFSRACRWIATHSSRGSNAWTGGRQGGCCESSIRRSCSQRFTDQATLSIEQPGSQHDKKRQHYRHAQGAEVVTIALGLCGPNQARCSSKGPGASPIPTTKHSEPGTVAICIALHQLGPIQGTRP